MDKTAFDLAVEAALEKIAISSKLMGRAYGKRLAQAGAVPGLKGFLPKNYKKSMEAAASVSAKRGRLYQNAIGRKMMKAEAAAGGGKRGTLAAGKEAFSFSRGVSKGVKGK